MPADPRTLGGTDPTSRLSGRVTELERLLGVGKGASVPGWLTPAYAAGWGPWRGDPWMPGYAKLSNGLVLLKGLVAKGTAPAAFELILTLPVGFRPGHQIVVPTLMNDTLSGVTVDSAGSVIIRMAGVAGGWLSLDPVTFRAEG